MSGMIKEFFDEHVMSPMFQLNELARKSGVQYEIKGREVIFTAREDAVGLAKELHNKVLEFGTWKVLREVAAQVKQDDIQVAQTVTPAVQVTPTNVSGM